MARTSDAAFFAFSLLTVVATGCTKLADSDERLDGAFDVGVADAGEDVTVDVPLDVPPDAEECIVPPSGCPPLCARTVEILGDDLDTGIRVIAVDARLDCTSLYRMVGPTFVEPGATLTIGPGVVIEARSMGYLVVQPGGTLEANGTSEEPIVFGSAEADPEPGDWGGVLMLGNAVVSIGESGSMTGEKVYDPLDGGRATFGGDDPGHDCGSLEYVRIQHGGSLNRLFVPEDFVGLGLAGCGTATTVDHVQLHAIGGEATQFIGGGFDVRHMVISEHRDDGINWNNGWTGTIQHMVVHMAYDNDNNAIEGRISAFPFPRFGPLVANVTLINPYMDGRTAMYLTAGAGMRAYNAIVLGSEGGLHVFESTRRNPGFYDLDFFTLENSIVDDAVPFTVDVEVGLRVDPPNRGNRSADPMLPPEVLEDDLHDPSFRPDAAGPANNGAADLSGTGLDETDYIGAIDPDGEDWTQGWTQYDP